MVRGKELGKNNYNKYVARRCLGCDKLWFTVDKGSGPAKRCRPCTVMVAKRSLGPLTLPEHERGLRAN